jgi:UDP:flavonoid glycosyltransferase YjiC (YdhE family)
MNPKEWQKFREVRKETLRDSCKNYNDWVVSKGFDCLPEDKMITPSPYLNIYMFPEELDYTDIRQLPSNWHRFDCFMRSGNEDTFEIPEKLRNKSGKLIYLSMGSMGGADVELMKRLVSILSKSKHRFIVSKGPLHDQYELADNVWGEKTVPQIKVLSVVDLVITHGGNNTFTETFFFGKPMIVMPSFGDQYDNAQRIEEKGFCIRINPYDFEENVLLESIEKLLNDQKLALKLTKISKRIQSSKNLTKVSELNECLVEKI